jgi:hypothetical protein
MADRAGLFLFQVRPDLFPQGFLTEAEVDLWAKFYENKQANHG